MQLFGLGLDEIGSSQRGYFGGWIRTALTVPCCAALTFAATSTWSGSAEALTQPGGVETIPVLIPERMCEEGSNVQACLDDNEGTPLLINAQNDALVAPEVFHPTCELTFSPLAKGGWLGLAFGWYNVTGGQPAQSELYVMVSVRTLLDKGGTVPPEELESLTARLSLAEEAAAGRYTGGEIGFWLATTENYPSNLSRNEETTALVGTYRDLYFTQHGLNAGSAYQVLTWQSVAVENAFYFGWEDRPAQVSSDNDFEDLVFIVTGIQCVGGGNPCETGIDGICGDGTMVCQKGSLECVQNVQPSDETCNALDDDCNGEVDEGDLCGTNEVCLRGKCVPHCDGSEFPCSSNKVCSEEGVCVDADCLSVFCESGQICVAGDCQGACAGIECPHGADCRNGACIDLCANIECDAGYTCVMGVCESCGCSPCPEGETCSNNVCTETTCVGVTCDSGQHCTGGTCVDSCTDTVCPVGQMCVTGECIADPNWVPGDDTGSGSGTGGSGVMIGPDGGIINAGGGASGTDGSSSGNSDGLTSSQPGCGCRTVGSNAWPMGGLAALLFGTVAATAAARRRRQTKR